MERQVSQLSFVSWKHHLTPHLICSAEVLGDFKCAPQWLRCSRCVCAKTQMCFPLLLPCLPLPWVQMTYFQTYGYHKVFLTVQRFKTNFDVLYHIYIFVVIDNRPSLLLNGVLRKGPISEQEKTHLLSLIISLILCQDSKRKPWEVS